MKTEKGIPGYVQGQKRIRTLRTILLLALVAAVFLAGLALNGGNRRNLFSIIAALCCIPFAMSCVGMFMMWMRRPVSKELVKAVSEKAAGIRVLYELYITTREHSLFLDAAAIRGNTVTAFTEDPKAAVHIPEVVRHLQRMLPSTDGPAEIKIFRDPDGFIHELQEISTEIPEDPDLEDAVGRTLKALSL